MQTVVQTFQTEQEKRAFVAEVEESYQAQMRTVLERLVAAKERVFTLSGPSCSGKTTTAHQLLDAMAKANRRIAVVSIDDFFLPRRTLHERQAVNCVEELDYDSLAALDFDYFCKCADLICAGKAAQIPKYDFISGERTGYTTLSPDAYDVVLFEGIQAIYPEVTAQFNQIAVCEVAIGIREDVCINGIFFDRREIRLMRRLLRDYRKRAASPQFTLSLWGSVARNEEKNILPYEENVTVRIASFLPYEVFVLKKPLSELLQSVPKDHTQYQTAQALVQKLEPMPEISESYVPSGSLFHEFL